MIYRSSGLEKSLREGKAMVNRDLACFWIERLMWTEYPVCTTISKRLAAYSIHKAVGFKKIGRADGIISLEITKEDYFHHEKIFYGKDNEDKKNY